MCTACCMGSIRPAKPLARSSRWSEAPVLSSPHRTTASRSQRRAPVALSSAMMAMGGAEAAASVGIQVATCLAWTSAIYMASRLLMQQGQAEEEGPRQECESCGGTGYTECWCNRWSDGDGGCSTCGGSRRMICSSCRGGGTAVPIEARLYIRPDQRSDNFRQHRR